MNPFSRVDRRSTHADRGVLDVWAPRPERVRLQLDGEVVAMERDDAGWWTPSRAVSLDRDVDYGYLLDDDPTPRPDPRSRRQPDGVHGLSRTYDPGVRRPADKLGALAGMGMTEKQGGSDVRANVTVARPTSAHGLKPSSWRSPARATPAWRRRPWIRPGRATRRASR